MADPFGHTIPGQGQEENIPIASSSNINPGQGVTTINPMDLFAHQQQMIAQQQGVNSNGPANGHSIFSQTTSVFAASPVSPQQQQHQQQDPDVTNTTSNSDSPARNSSNSNNIFGFQQTLPLEQFPKSRKTGYVYDVRMMLHAPFRYRVDENDNFLDDGFDEIDPETHHRRSHPEEPRRISKIFERLKKRSLIARMVELPCREVEPREVMLVHTERLWDTVMQTHCKSEDIRPLTSYPESHVSTLVLTDEDIQREYQNYERHSLYVNNSTASAARLSCGGVISATKAVVTGVVRNAIAIVRPPGHHAEPDQSMGFSFFNNVAVAAKVAQTELGVKKVLILDW